LPIRKNNIVDIYEDIIQVHIGFIDSLSGGNIGYGSDLGTS